MPNNEISTWAKISNPSSDELVKKWEAWRKFNKRPYSRYGNARKNNREMIREKREAREKGGPLKTAIKDLISEEIMKKLLEIK